MSENRISIIVPVRNAVSTMGRCLEAIYGSTTRPHEVVVIDDGCTDGTMDVVRGFPARIVKSEGSGGVAAARNQGSAATEGEVLFFLDADVILEPGALAAARDAMADGNLAVAVGLQSAESPYSNATSVYKNLWLRYTYRIRAGRFAVLYSSAVAIRRTDFERVDGFDTNYRQPNIEDSELGMRISEAGGRVDLVPGIEFLHIKRYDVISMLRTDFHRTVGMTKVQLRDRFQRIRRENYTSIPTSFLISCLSPWLVVIAWLAGFRPGPVAWPLLLLSPALPIALLNIGWLRYLARRMDLRLAWKGVLLLHLDVAAVNAGFAWGVLEYLTGKRY